MAAGTRSQNPFVRVDSTRCSGRRVWPWLSARPKAAGKGRLYGLCVWLSAVVVLCACGAAASLAVWLLGLWPDTTPRPELFASSAAAMVVQWSIFLVDGRRRLGGGWIGSSILLAIAVINLVLFL